MNMNAYIVPSNVFVSASLSISTEIPSLPLTIFLPEPCKKLSCVDLKSNHTAYFLSKNSIGPTPDKDN